MGKITFRLVLDPGLFRENPLDMEVLCLAQKLELGTGFDGGGVLNWKQILGTDLEFKLRSGSLR